MPIPADVLDGAWSGQEVGAGVDGSGEERLLSAIAAQALRQGAQVGLTALVEAIVCLSGSRGVAFYTDGQRRLGWGQEPPGLEQALPWQCFQDGSTVLVLAEPCRDAGRRRLLGRMAELGSALLASRAREEEARLERDGLRLERLRLRELLAHRERAWARAAHDLRTPLLVLQGYIEMMNKGIAGALTPPMQRYLERMRQSAADLNQRLQNRQRGEGVSTADLRPLLNATFGPGRAHGARLELPESPLRVRAPHATLTLLVRALERVVAGADATGVELLVDVPDDSQVWRLRLSARAGRAVPERALLGLERLARRGDVKLALSQEAGGEALGLELLLPRIPN